MQGHIEAFLISFLVGLVIGIDRERSLPKGMKGMGVRSFTLVAIMGTLAATIKDANLTLIVSAFILGAILLNYHYTAAKQEKAKSIGITTGLAASVVYVLGYIAPKEPVLSAVIGGVILAMLVGREALHTFAKEKLKPREISAAATMLIIFICVLVFLPNQTIDPWNLFNPRKFGVLIAIIATIQFSGYVAIRVFGDRLGVLFMGFFGGLVSSTAVFATLPHFVKKHPERTRTACAAGIFSTVAMLLEFSIIITVAAPELFVSVSIPVIAMIAVGVVSALMIYSKEGDHQKIDAPKNPLDFRSVFYLSSVIGGMIIIVAVVKLYLGVDGVKIVSFLGALFEIHGVSLATATLYVAGKLSLLDARVTLLVALFASYITKFVLLMALSRNRFGLLTASVLLLMVGLGATAGIANGFVTG